MKPAISRRFLWVAASALAAAGSLFAHSLTTIRGDIPNTSFSCSETIVVRVDWSPVPRFRQSASAEWVNNDTGLRHSTRIAVEPETPASYLWMKFDAPGGAGFSRVVSPDQASDQFAGRWSVQVFLNGEHVGTTEFDVRC